MLERLDLVALFRLLARRSPFHLGLGYSAAATVALIVYRLGAAVIQTPVLVAIAGIIGTVAISLLITVVVWYRGDDVLEASILLVTITGVGSIAAYALTEVLFTGSIAAIVFFGVSGGMGLLVRLVLLVPPTMLLVWVGRRLRGVFAPSTVDDEDLPE